MAYISFQPKDFFSTKLYTGTGSTQTISGVGFQPDFTWVKDRDATEAPTLFDSARGATKRLYSSSTAAESTSAISLTAWNSDGFAIGSGGEVNTNNDKFVSWNWKMGTTTVPSGGSITPSAVSIDTTRKQGIYKYTGNATAGATIAHGLGQAPQFVIIKDAGGSREWACYHGRIDGDLTQAGDYYLRLNTTEVRRNDSGKFNDTNTTDTLVTLGSDAPTNNGGNEMIMYAFCNVPGYSRMGRYFGTNRSHGSFVYTGFKPSFIMLKTTGVVYGWYMYDVKRGYNGARQYLQANSTSAGDTNEGNFGIDILANGFKIHGTYAGINADGDGIVYMAMAEHPLVSSNGKAATAV